MRLGAVLPDSGAVRQRQATMIGQPEYFLNGSLFARHGRFEARLDDNYQPEGTYSLSGSPADDYSWSERRIFSAKIKYNVGEKFIIQVRINNFFGVCVF